MLPSTPEEFERFLTEREGPHLECKEARGTYSSDKLKQYLSALANEGGGYFVLGVSDQPPRRVVGSTVFPNAYRDAANTRQALDPAPFVDVREIQHRDGRVVVFEVGSRPTGRAVRHQNVPYVRLGESAVRMDDEELRRILLEGVDATAEPVPGRTLRDLDSAAVKAFQEGVQKKATNEETRRRYGAMKANALLNAFGLLTDDGTLTKAALLLMGTEAALRSAARNAEVVFEYRRTPGAITPAPRVALRRPMLLAIEELWAVAQPLALSEGYEVREGTRVVREPRFPERSVREAILNALAHRDYHDDGEIRIQMDPRTFTVTSPGRFVAPVTPENIAFRQARRNRALAEALDACGQIERSGLGVDLMIQAAVRRGQPLPMFDEPDGRAARVVLSGDHDPNLIDRFSTVSEETWDSITTPELIALDAVRRRAHRSQVDADAARLLLGRGFIEPGGPGDTPYSYGTSLSLVGGGGMLILPVLRTLLDYPKGATLAELSTSVGTEDVDALKRTLQWLRRNGFVHTEGRTRSARWHVLRERVLETLKDVVD